jgi:hypothetical protein
MGHHRRQVKVREGPDRTTGDEALGRSDSLECIEGQLGSFDSRGHLRFVYRLANPRPELAVEMYLLHQR